MPIAFDNAGSVSGTSVSSLTTAAWSISGTDRLLVAGVMADGGSGGPAITAVKWGGSGGVSLSLVGSDNPYQCATYLGLTQWYLVAPATGSGTLYASFGATADEAFIGGVSLTGVDQATPLGSPGKASGSTNPSSTVTASVTLTSAAGEWIVDLVGNISNGLPSPGAGQTSRWSFTKIAGYPSGNCSTMAGAASVTPQYTAPTDPYSCGWGMLAVPVKPVQAAAAIIGSDAGSRRNRPGRGPYSSGAYYRPRNWLESFLVGAQSYSVAMAESGSASDAVSAQAQFGAAIAETASATDTLTTVATFLRSVAETASATDTAAAAMAFAPSLTESGSAADTVTSAVGGYDVTLTETATAVDAIAALVNWQNAITESGAASDTVSNIATLLAALAESASAADAYTSALNANTYSVSLTEAASAVDSIAALLQAGVTISESGSAAETLATLAQFGVAVAEAAAALEVLTAGGISNVTISEVANATDLVTAPTGFGTVPPGRTIFVRQGNRVIAVTLGNRTIRVH